MIYIILAVVGSIGIALTLWLDHPRLRAVDTYEGDPWYVFHPENFESGVIQYARSIIRFWLKRMLIALIALYRIVSQKITIQQTVKKSIRAFLYEHTHDGIRKPSEFWEKVRKAKK